MLSLSLMLIFAAAAAAAPRAAPADEGPQAVRVTTAAVAERIQLPHTRAPIELIVDPLSARLELRAGRDAAALAARVATHAGNICPKVIVKTTGVELRCRTRRFDASITTEGTKTYLDIQELRGLPWREGPGGPPFFHYEPFRSGLGDACPGSTPGGRGECALLDKDRLQAAIQFRGAIESGQKQVAMLRLGDLALGTGDPTTALGWYYRAGSLGVFGRVARARICEISGECLGSTEAVKRVFDAAGLPEPLRADLHIRAVRAEAFEGRFESAIHLLSAQIEIAGAGSLCREGGEVICRRVILEVMRQGVAVPTEGDGNASSTGERLKTGEQALDAYLSLGGWDKGPLAVELSQAAAELASRLGAPVFGGNILAAVAPEVPADDLSDHLLRAAELFLDGDDPARTQLVMEYAQTRFVKRTSARWKAVQRLLAARMNDEDEAHRAPPELKPAVDAAEAAREVAAALAAAGRARLVTSEAHPPAAAGVKKK
jgi:hypothetical protein